jgi:hypothetical protein
MVDWSKDRNRQLMIRARAEQIEDKIKEWSAKPARNIRPSIGKAALRAMGEELVRQYEERRGQGETMDRAVSFKDRARTRSR